MSDLTLDGSNEGLGHQAAKLGITICVGLLVCFIITHLQAIGAGFKEETEEQERRAKAEEEATTAAARARWEASQKQGGKDH